MLGLTEGKVALQPCARAPKFFRPFWLTSPGELIHSRKGGRDTLKVCYYKPRFSAGDDEPESLQARLEAGPQSLGSPARIGKPPGAHLALREITASHSRQEWPRWNLVPRRRSPFSALLAATGVTAECWADNR